jgi:hypothetical protein
MSGGLQCKEEYRALRDEMLNFFTRVLVLFAASVAAFVTLTLKGLEQSDQWKGGLIFLLAILILLVAILLSLEFYRNLYSIGSYICVYFEDPNAGWHIRSRHMRLILKKKNVGGELNYLEKVNEPRTLSFAYFLMVTSLPILFFLHLGKPKCEAYYLLVSLLVIVSWVVTIVLIWCFLWNVYEDESTKGVARWSAYKIDCPEPKLEDICGNVRRR